MSMISDKELLEKIEDISSERIELKGIKSWDMPVDSAILFNTGQRREKELATQKSREPVTKVYVVLNRMGLYTANAILSSDGVRLTNLQLVESLKEFVKTLTAENRASEAWRLAVEAGTNCGVYLYKHP